MKAESIPWLLVLMGTRLPLAVMIRLFVYGIQTLESALRYCKSKGAEFTRWPSVPEETCLPVVTMVRPSVFGMQALESVSKRYKDMEIAFSQWPLVLMGIHSQVA